MASYLNVYLERYLGFDGGALGLFNGLTALAPAAVLPVVGWWADRTGRGGGLLTLALLLLLLSGGLLGGQTTFWGALSWGVVWEIARSLCVPLADRQAMALSGSRGYGGLRCCGSLGFLCGGMAVGLAARRWALGHALFPVYLTLVALAGALSFALHGNRGGNARPVRAQQALRLLRRPAFRLALAMGILNAVAVNALQPYLGSHLVNALGAGELWVSWNTVCCVAPELVLLPLCSARLLPRWGFRRALLVIALSCALRSLIYALSPSPGVFLLGSLLYSVSVCGHTAVSLALLRRVAGEELYATAVLLNAGTATLGRALFGWLFGALSQHGGSGGIFWLMLACSLGAAALVRRSDCLRGL